MNRTTTMIGAALLLSASTHPSFSYAASIFSDPGQWWEDVKKAADRDARKIGEDLDALGRNLERIICDIATLGDYSRGNAGCSISAGVSVDQSGEVSGYNPASPHEKYRAPPEKSDTPSDHDLKKFEEYRNQPAFQSFELVLVVKEERARGDFKGDGATFARITPSIESARYEPLGGDKGFSSPTGSWELREAIGGSPGFFASRKVRFHRAIDFRSTAGQDVFSPVNGRVVDIVHYKTFTGVHIESGSYEIKVLYVDVPPAMREKILAAKQKGGVLIRAGQRIGTAQSLASDPGYRHDKVPDHVHVQIKDAKGRFVDPSDPSIRIEKR